MHRPHGQRRPPEQLQREPPPPQHGRLIRLLDLHDHVVDHVCGICRPYARRRPDRVVRWVASKTIGDLLHGGCSGGESYAPRYWASLPLGVAENRVSAAGGVESKVPEGGRIYGDGPSAPLFEWFYDTGFPKQVHLANLSGGTDICGSFA